ncbi:M28 family peptidase [Rufibacter tibetensis]|uniref:Peptidase M28 n=1 Tax=Rufibacter tibetensis TaxID=512763 RepID=A0A0P0CE78_9BACT|nr:M28 family peptidase [Rufibacter tibetensis]ALJ00141.1 peptidase M28 [Rufibacter tibetensis]
MPIQRDRLYADVQYLTTLKPPRSIGHPESLKKAEEYIEAQFCKLSGRVQKQALHQGFNNLIFSYGPEDGERVIVGAHYDVFGETPGADDNASAVAGLLELARALHEEKPEVKHRIDFVAYNFEEPPYFATEKMGSAVHAKSMKKDKVDVKLMICLEMIGFFTDKPNSQEFQHESMKKMYPTTGNFIVVVGKMGQERTVQRVQQFMKEHSRIDVQSIAAPEGLPGVGLSDHRNYWAQGYQAVMINDTSFLRNPHYHQRSDTIDTLDFARMTEVVRGVYAAMLNF